MILVHHRILPETCSANVGFGELSLSAIEFFKNIFVTFKFEEQDVDLMQSSIDDFKFELFKKG